MELHDGNTFKIKAINNTAYRLSKYSEPLSQKSPEELEKIEGIGKSVAAKIVEFINTGKIEELEALIAATPDGLIELLQIKGLGPKKIQTIWKELGIESMGELYYACNENRLVEAKGFGLKTQEEVKRLIEFTMNNKRKFLYASLEPLATAFKKNLSERFPDSIVEYCSALRRKCEILEWIDILIGTENPQTVFDYLNTQKQLRSETQDEAMWTGLTDEQFPIRIHTCKPENFANSLFKLTASKEHLKQLNIDIDTLSIFKSEEAIYQSLSLSYIEPELREGVFEFALAKKNQLPKLIEPEDLLGSLHNHSTWSDGIHTLREMAEYCKKSGYTYLGICDHSKSAFYANGLKEDRVIQQQEEIDLLNKELFPFRIFKGIESDILYDGSLDYDKAILSTFDFVVASVHSNLKMNIDKADERLIKAIENPYTTILGHPTGRLLLAREGYPINHAKIIDACAANGVVIELNANPLRLDIDWRWIPYALGKGVRISINPDAHRKEGFADMYYGVCVARKGGLSKEACLNSLHVSELENYFNTRKPA